jgi:hypothetical protein
MKSLTIKLVALMAILILSGEVRGAGAARSLVLYDEPPATYVVALEFVTIRTTSVAFVTVTLPDGRKQELPRSGIVAIIEYPPDTPTGSFPNDATTTTQNIRALSAKYPQCAAKLNRALNKWTNALAFYQQKQKSASAVPQTPPARGTTIQIGGVKYTDATLTSFDGVFVGIEHSAGFARIPAISLKTEQILALNATSSSVRIDPSKIVVAMSKAAATPPVRGDQNTTVSVVAKTQGSAPVAPEDISEIARLKDLVAQADALIQKLTTELKQKPGAQVAYDLSQAEFHRGKAIAKLLGAQERANAKIQEGKTKAYEAAATLPSTSTDWDAIVTEWTAKVVEQTKAAEAAKNAIEVGWNRPERQQLADTMNAENKRLWIAEQTLAKAKSQAAESARLAREDNERIARYEKAELDKAAQTALASAPKDVPASWLDNSPDAKNLAKQAGRCFSSTSSDTEALAESIKRIPGIETKQPGHANVILTDLMNGRSTFGIRDELFWSLFHESIEQWNQSGIMGACPFFIAKEFLDSLTCVKVFFELSGKQLDWESPEAERVILSQFRDIVWATKQIEVRRVTAFGSLIHATPWSELKAFKLSSGEALRDKIEALQKEVANEHCIAIEFMLEGILQKIPADTAFSENKVFKRAADLTGMDFENAYNRGLLDNLATLHGRSFRFALAARIEGIIRHGGSSVPEQLDVRALLAQFNSLQDVQNANELAPAIAKALPELPESECVRVATMVANAARVAVKELVK